MLDIFLDSFWLGEDTRDLVNHLLLVTVDQTSFERCKFLRLHCYKLETDGVEFEREKVYMSNDFIKMMWRRTLFLGDVLKRGYNFIFTVSFFFLIYFIVHGFIGINRLVAFSFSILLLFAIGPGILILK